MKIDNHDKANTYAARLRIHSNPVNGVLDFVVEETEDNEADVAAEIGSRAQQLTAEKLAKLQAEQEVAVAHDESESTEDSEAEAPVSRAETQQGKTTTVVMPAVPPRKTLMDVGIDQEVLETQLGIPKVSIGATWRVESEDDLESLLAKNSDWEKDAIVGLIAGLATDEVKKDLGLAPASPTNEVELGGDEIVTQLKEKGLVPEASEEGLQEIWEKGSSQEWRVSLHHSRRKAALGDHKGSTRVIGGAGTSKTVVLVHCAECLAEKYPDSSILLTIFTRDFASQLKTLISIFDPSFPEVSSHGAPGLWISGIDAPVCRVLGNAQTSELEAAMKSVLGIRGSSVPRSLGDYQEDQMWQEAAELHGEGMHPPKLQSEFLHDELVDVILTSSISTEKEYLRVSCQGRGTLLNRVERKKVWVTHRPFLRSCELEEQLPSPALAVVGAEVLEHRGVPMFEHALIDEVQDFHAGHWRFLRAVAAEGADDIFTAEDSYQRIYGRRIMLRNCGIETRGGVTKRLRINYRTTVQNLSYATSILEGTEWADSEAENDILVGYRSLANGPAPIITHAAGKQEEFNIVATTIRQWLDSDSPSMHVDILTQTNRQSDELETFLGEKGISVSGDRFGAVTLKNEVSVMTMHNAKGIEFTDVILADVSLDNTPKIFRLNALAESEQNDALQRERALLYVTASRARDQLVTTMVGASSELLP